MMRDRMTYRFAGFGIAVSLRLALLLYLTTLSIQPTEAHIGINSQADLALFLISGGIMTSTLDLLESSRKLDRQSPVWDARSDHGKRCVPPSSLLRGDFMARSATICESRFDVDCCRLGIWSVPSFETVFWLLAAAGATAVAVWAFGLMGVAWTVAFRR